MLVGYFITSYPTRAHGIIVIYFKVFAFKLTELYLKIYNENYYIIIRLKLQFVTVFQKCLKTGH